METPQDKIREFFWELDKMLGPDHPFIVLHGPADTFREYLENNIEDTRRLEEELEERDDSKYERDTLVEELKDIETCIKDNIYNLKEIISDLSTITPESIDELDGIQDAMEEIVVNLKDAL